MTDLSDVLERFHRALVEEISDRRPEYLTGPFTVAEIYQNLIPYGTHRDRIGVEMNGDYEDALIRLLAGEGNFLVLESSHALKDLQEELQSPNPNTGMYREFAAVDVRLNQARLDLPGAALSQEVISLDDLAPSSSPAKPGPKSDTKAVKSEAKSAAKEVSQATAIPTPAAAPEPEAAADAHACRWCRAELPQREDLNFCPFCGTDVHVVPCPGCSEELEPDWRFCIACGVEVAG